MSDMLNYTGSGQSAAGRPDYGKLAQAGVITLGADGFPVGSAKTPVIGKKQITIRVDGTKQRVEIPVNGGHAVNPDFPKWRAGLNPEKFHEKVLKEAEVQASTNNPRVKVAPDLTSEEAEDYLKWLEEQGIKASDTAPKQLEEVKDEVISRTVAAAEKTVRRGRPKKA